MIQKNVENASKRALNIIWNAAGRYHFDPGFLAVRFNGQPDIYFNMVIGLTEKWVGLDLIRDVFSSYAFSGRAPEIDEILWLALEHYVFEKECPERPLLRSLRARRAEDFFRSQQSLSRQQMMLQSMRVLRQQQYRWAYVSGRPLPHLSGEDARLAKYLQFSSDMEARQVSEALRLIPKQFFGVDPEKSGRRIRLSKSLSALRTRLRAPLRADADLLLVRTGGSHTLSEEETTQNIPAAITGGRFTAPRRANPEEDLRYIRETFGECLLPERELAQMEASLCTGADTGCRLYVASPRRGAQYERNLDFNRKNMLLIRESIKTLSARLETVFCSWLRAEPVPSRSGRLRSEAAYRIPLFSDTKVFQKNGEELDNPISVTLLLDASRSRMNSQERIASEAYIITESLRLCHVPVSVLCFRSLRGFTILEELKKETDADPEGTLRYYAGGWNRDALALKATGFVQRQKKEPADRLHVLLVFTDASPNDSYPIASLSRSGIPCEGSAAAALTREAVAALRDDGMPTAAIFHGSTAHLENVSSIYGKDYVRIRSLQQFAGAAGDLLENILRERLA